MAMGAVLFSGFIVGLSGVKPADKGLPARRLRKRACQDSPLVCLLEGNMRGRQPITPFAFPVGSPGTGIDRTKLEARFWSKVKRGTDNECWEWLGPLDRHGYGSFGIKCLAGYTLARSHRVAYWLSKGPLSQALTVDHLCRNRACQNPNHMELVTRGMNVLRGTGLTAQHIKKTHCPQGHAYDSLNSYVDTTTGGRLCRICRRQRDKVSYDRKAR